MKLRIVVLLLTIMSVVIVVWFLSDKKTSENLKQHQFTISNKVFEISLPLEFQKEQKSTTVQFLLVNHRVPRQLAFSIYQNETFNYQKNIKLNSKAKISYLVNENYGAGSGGIEAELIGTIYIDSFKLNVYARDQDENSPNPKWCMDYLKTLRIK